MSEQDPSRRRPGSAGRRPGRNTTFSVEAYNSDAHLDPIRPQDLVDPESTGAAMVGEDMDGYHQPTAMFDKGQFLGELAELDKVPETHAHVEAEIQPPKGCRLIIVAGPDLGIEWAFKQPEVTMGRDEDCELVMSDIAVSRRHAKIALEGVRFFLSDLGSGNGTYLNGVRIEREELSPGDEITVGERTMRFVELNDAPATAAAHPIPKPLPAEPSVGDVRDPADDSAGFEPLGRASQIDVAVVPASDGPSAASAVVVSARKGGRKPGTALRTAALVFGTIAVVAGLSVAGWLAYQRWFAGETPAQRLARAKVEFLQGVELVKTQRFGDAILMFDRVIASRPEYARAVEYREHALRELAEWKKLDGARALAKESRYVEAIEAVGKVDANSAYKKEAEELAKSYHRAIATGMLADARARMLEGDLEGALALVEQALERAPTLKGARLLKAEIEDAKKGREPPPRPKKVFTIPPQLMRAVALYKNGQIGPAIDAAEAASGPEAPEYVQRMRRVKSLMEEASEAHRKKAAAELLRIAPAALELDKAISGGDGNVRERLTRFYADGLYLKGIEAYQAEDEVRAYKLLSEALQQQPGHKLAETRLAELSGKARDIYYQGYVLKDSNKPETRKIFRRLIQMTRSDNHYHQLAAKWLADNGG